MFCFAFVCLFLNTYFKQMLVFWVNSGFIELNLSHITAISSSSINIFIEL